MAELRAVLWQNGTITDLGTLGGAESVGFALNNKDEVMGSATEAWAERRGRPPLITGKVVTFIDRRGTVSTRRAREELGWEPRVDLDEGLRRTEAWLRAEGLI